MLRGSLRIFHEYRIQHAIPKAMNILSSVSSGLYLLTASACMGQCIPNGDFEEWVTSGDHDQPANWATNNPDVVPGPLYPCTRGTPGHSGNYFMHLQPVDNGEGWLCGDDASLGDSILTASQGMPWDTRPLILTGYWRYHVALRSVVVFLSRWDPFMGIRQQVGSGEYTITGSKPSWESFTIPLVYSMGTMPDTVEILFHNASMPAVGEFFDVDDLAFDPIGIGTGIADGTGSSNALLLYPSPCASTLNVVVDALFDQLLNVRIMDLQGSLVRSASATGPRFAMDLSGVAPGNYVVEVGLPDGSALRRPLSKI